MLLVAQLWLTLCGYAMAVLLARGLAPARYGIYGVVYSVLLSVELIGRLGLPQAITKLAAEASDRDRRVETTAVTIAGVASLALFLAFWAVAPWLASLLRIEDGAWLFRIAALDIPFYGLFFIAIALLNGRQQHLAAGVATGCYATVKLAGIAVLAALGPTVEGALVANVVGSAAGLAAATVAIGGPRLRAQPRGLARGAATGLAGLAARRRRSVAGECRALGAQRLGQRCRPGGQGPVRCGAQHRADTHCDGLRDDGRPDRVGLECARRRRSGDRLSAPTGIESLSPDRLGARLRPLVCQCQGGDHASVLGGVRRWRGRHGRAGGGARFLLLDLYGADRRADRGVQGGSCRTGIPWGDGGGHPAVLGPGAGFRRFGRGARHPDRDGRCRGRSRRSGLAGRGSLAERAGVRTRLAGDWRSWPFRRG